MREAAGMHAVLLLPDADDALVVARAEWRAARWPDRAAA